MQGKACFNFTEIAPEELREIADLTRVGIEMLKDMKLPWATPEGKAVGNHGKRQSSAHNRKH